MEVGAQVDRGRPRADRGPAALIDGGGGTAAETGREAGGARLADEVHGRAQGAGAAQDDQQFERGVGMAPADLGVLGILLRSRRLLLIRGGRRPLAGRLHRAAQPRLTEGNGRDPRARPGIEAHSGRSRDRAAGAKRGEPEDQEEDKRHRQGGVSQRGEAFRSGRGPDILSHRRVWATSNYRGYPIPSAPVKSRPVGSPTPTAGSGPGLPCSIGGVLIASAAILGGLEPGPGRGGRGPRGG